MTNWRIIQKPDGDGVPYYTIADVVTGSRPFNVNPFVRHEPPYPSAGSIDELRDRLKEMLTALDKPPLIWKPATLVEKEPVKT